MKKRALTILMILILATAGLFAISIPVPGTVSASLKANIGEYLEHGFTVSSVKYQASTEVLDAFSLTPPSFVYGYKTNAPAANFLFKMTVGDFINQATAGVVKIQLVTSSKTITHTASTNTYEVFSFANTAGNAKVDEATITIKPFQTFTTGAKDITDTTISADQTIQGDLVNSLVGAPSGPYKSVVSFEIIVT